MNQDAVLAVRLSDGRELVAVADGMGGHSAGEVASQRALETVWTRLKAGLDLSGAVAAANAELHSLAAANPAWSGMGTTLVALLRAGSSYEIANVGDSRAYRITEESVGQITTDHSFVAEAMREARLATDEIVSSRWRNALTRALGTEADVAVDVFGPFDARERHAVLLCTDGLHRSVSDEVLKQHVARADDPWAAAQALTAEAYRNGSSDNISAAVVLFGDEEPPRQRVDAPIVLAQPKSSRRRRRSRHVRRTELQLAVTIVLLILVVMVLMRVW
ncbi:MAG TPA: protein phosphatase 2C domain-containing protein [Longimicrobiales bacterium]